MNDPGASPIRRALISVSDKTQLDVLADILIESKVEVLSTGGTAKALRKFGVEVVPVSEYTGSPEILGGRVKTLHPKVHGGILALPTAAHQAELSLHGMAPIDLVVVNLYPFQKVTANPDCTFDDAIENIDIGGPTMVRAAAKSWQRVAVVVDPSDYAALGESLRANNFTVPEQDRLAFARKAFAHTAAYDAAIATYLHGEQPSAGGLHVAGAAQQELRYGENPHQKAHFYRLEVPSAQPGGLGDAVQLQGKPLSYNNFLDADGALNVIRDLASLGTAAAVLKHVSPCGAAYAPKEEAASIADIYLRAREADAESAFGGIVAVTEPVDEALARHLVETFLEVVLATSYTPEAREVLKRKKNLRLLEIPNMFTPHTAAPLRIRSVTGGLLAQREDLIGVRVAQGNVVTKRAPTAKESTDLELALVVGKHVRSNAIVLCRDGMTVGVGGGQTSRVEASRQASRRAGERAQGAVLGSDAFFPFRDGIDAAAAAGVTAIVAPGGSRRDAEVIAAADEHGLAMVFTGERHFRH